MAAVAARLDPDAIRGTLVRESEPRPAARPEYSVLGTERGAPRPPLEESVLRFVRDRTAVGTAA